MSGAAVAEYDFFIAHAGGDTAEAERLFHLLHKHARVFLDSRCLKLGDQWDIVLPEAQRRSRVTVVIVSPRTEAAFYQREEVAAAIELARHASHRVVPVFVEGPLGEDSAVPYGLRRLHHAVLSDRFTREDLARQLLGLISVDAGIIAVQPGVYPGTPQHAREQHRKVLDDLFRAKGVSLDVAQRALPLLRQELKGDEELLGACQLNYADRLGYALLAITSQRLVLADEGLFVPKIREIPFQQVSAAQAERGIINRYLVVSASPKGFKAIVMPSHRAEELAALINERIQQER